MESMKLMNERELVIEKYRKTTIAAREQGQLDLVMRELMRNDLFFLLLYGLNYLSFANNDWVFARCREFEADRDGYLDLWPREHFKSSAITLAGVIQEVLRDPEITIGIFSFNRPSAKVFLNAIKTQFEMNDKLKELFPEIFYPDPAKESPKWSSDDGILVRRKTMPKEMTVEAYGVVDGMPTGRHYKLRVYDDLVVKESVSSPEMINKVTEAVSLSFNLGSIQSDRMWMVGTRYHMADTYSVLVKRGAVKVREYGATKDGTFDGEPWLWTREQLARKIKIMGTYVASCQLFNNPVMEGEQTFAEEWLRYWVPKETDRMNMYIVVDPANSKSKKSDYTVVMVIGLGPDRNYYLVDGLRDKLSVRERCQRVMALHAQYHPLVVGYEKYGMQTDIDFMQEMMGQQQYRFPVVELGGSMGKTDRIKRLQPLFQSGRFYIPEKLVRVDYQGKAYDLTQSFIQDEYLQFPYMVHDDMLDCMARITDEDMRTSFPSPGMIDPKTGRTVLDDGAGEVYDYDTYAYADQDKGGATWRTP
jgi:predicted phage terminase large subunit-like protein